MLTSVLDQFSKWFLHHQSFAAYIEPLIQVVKPAWRAGFFRAQIVDVYALSGQFLSVTLKPNKQWRAHIAGQHISLTLELTGVCLPVYLRLLAAPRNTKQPDCCEF